MLPQEKSEKQLNTALLKRIGETIKDIDKIDKDIDFLVYVYLYQSLMNTQLYSKVLLSVKKTQELVEKYGKIGK